jgi:putative protease
MKHELLAPAGNIEAGYAALYYGADAVYLGLTKFSARAGAENFTAEELDEFTAYAHSLKKKVCVALNTILTEEETKELPETFATLKKAKVDALIIQDLGVYYLARQFAPEIELHASTQMAVHNAEGAKFLYSLGFKRVVLARELTLAEIKLIAKAVPEVELEVFIHGALCYSYSGQCLFSALEYGKSANRGRCIYPCRAEYGKQDRLKAHYFSMKDLALEEQVLDIPAYSLKIEGRKKSPLYVAAVTNYYRHILDGKKKSLNEAEDIKQIFSRPWCRFHFNGKDKNITDEEFVGHRGLLIGKVEKINKNRLGFKTVKTIARYDGLQIDVSGSEKPFGFGIKALYVNNKSVFEAPKNQYVEVELPPEHPHLTIGEPIYLASSSAVKGRYDYQKPKPKEYQNAITHAVRIEITADKIWALSGNIAVESKGTFTPAKDTAKTTVAAKEAFAKTGGTGIVFDNVEIINPDNLFIPVSILNDLRRQLVEALQAEDTAEILTLPPLKPLPQNTDAPKNLNLFSLSQHTNVAELNQETINTAWFVLPQICRNTKALKDTIDELYHQGARQFVAENYYAFEILKPYKGLKIAAGSFLYVMNSYAALALKEIGVSWATLALESSPDNMKEVISHSPLPLAQVIKSYPPLFTSAVCLRKNACQDCPRGELKWNIKKDGKEYTVVSRDCMIQLFAKTPYERAAITGVWGIINKE